MGTLYGENLGKDIADMDWETGKKLSEEDLVEFSKKNRELKDMLNKDMLNDLIENSPYKSKKTE